MFKKLFKEISLVLLLSILLQIITPLTSLATNIGEFNNENIALEFEEVFVTTLEKDEITHIKTYDKNGMLLEKIILDRKNIEEYKVINYDKSNNNQPSIETINFEEEFGVKPSSIENISYNKIKPKKQYSLNRAYGYEIGRGTVKSHSQWSNFERYYVDVSYEHFGNWKSGQYLVNSGTYAGGKFLVFIIGLFNIQTTLGVKIIDTLIAWGVAEVIGKGYSVIFDTHLNGDKIDIDVIGRDSRDSDTVGILYGTKWKITQIGEHYGKTLYEGVDLDNWGDKSITYSLIKEMYPGLHYDMEVLSER